MAANPSSNFVVFLLLILQSIFGFLGSENKIAFHHIVRHSFVVLFAHIHPSHSSSVVVAQRSDSVCSEDVLHTLVSHHAGCSVQRGHLSSPVFVSIHLFQVLLAGSLGSKDPLGFAVHVCLVLDGNTAEMAEDVFHLGISAAATRTSQVVDGLHADEDVVDHGDNDNHTNRVTPDDHDSHNRCLCAVVVTTKPILGLGEELVWFSREPA